jgi:hypothetical protein
LSLPAADGNYFLRPDMIRGAFLLDPTSGYPEGRDSALNELETEKLKDIEVQQKLKKCSEDLKRNSANTKEARLLRGMYINDENKAASTVAPPAVVAPPVGASDEVKSPRSKPAPRVSPSKYEVDGRSSSDGGVDNVELSSKSSSKNMDSVANKPKKAPTPRKKSSSPLSNMSKQAEATL